jgi:hypothetical protein
MTATLQTTNIQNASSSTTNLALDTSGNVSVGSSLTAANNITATSGTVVMASSFLRNKIINGAMVIDQRNAGASGTSAAPTYTVDRWSVYGTQSSKFSWQQNAGSVTPPAGFTNYLGITSSSAYSVTSTDRFQLNQAIEGYNVADLAYGTANAKTTTLSFWVYSSLTGTFGGCIGNNAGNRSYPFTYTISSSNTWTYITVTIPGDTSGTWLTTNGIGLYVYFGLGVGSTLAGTAGSWSGNFYVSATGATSVVGTNGATFYITGVQLEVGSVATPFEQRQFGTELALCQRYYYKATTGTSYNQLAFCNIRTTTSHYAFMQLPVTMRANPTSVDYGSIGVIASWGATVVGLTSLSLANASYGPGTTQVLLDAVTSSAVGTVGQVSMLLGNNSATGFVALNSEL